jgi:5-methyltetrahydrofolate--homocysteine methyltransferase
VVEHCQDKLQKHSTLAWPMQSHSGSNDHIYNIVIYFIDSVGLNCALGAQEIRPYLQQLSKIANCFVHCYPNAGLPNALGAYDQTPSEMAQFIREFAGIYLKFLEYTYYHRVDEGLVNIVGGCCGTNPDFIAAIAQAVEGCQPRQVPTIEPTLRVAGLSPLVFTPNINFVNVGERCNVTGSRRFANLIKNNKYEASSNWNNFMVSNITN